MGRSAGNVGEQIGMGRSAGSVGEQIGKRPICSQFRLKNRPADSLQFMLAFRPHSDLLAGASTVSARPVCASAGLLARRVNRPASKLVRTYTMSSNNSHSFMGIASIPKLKGKSNYEEWRNAM